jgi:hypothetical protein
MQLKSAAFEKVIGIDGKEQIDGLQSASPNNGGEIWVQM